MGVRVSDVEFGVWGNRCDGAVEAVVPHRADHAPVEGGVRGVAARCVAHAHVPVQIQGLMLQGLTLSTSQFASGLTASGFNTFTSHIVEFSFRDSGLGLRASSFKGGFVRFEGTRTRPSTRRRRGARGRRRRCRAGTGRTPRRPRCGSWSRSGSSTSLPGTASGSSTPGQGLGFGSGVSGFGSGV